VTHQPRRFCIVAGTASSLLGIAVCGVLRVLSLPARPRTAPTCDRGTNTTRSRTEVQDRVLDSCGSDHRDGPCPRSSSDRRERAADARLVGRSSGCSSARRAQALGLLAARAPVIFDHRPLWCSPPEGQQSRVRTPGYASRLQRDRARLHSRAIPAAARASGNGSPIAAVGPSRTHSVTPSTRKRILSDESELRRVRQGTRILRIRRAGVLHRAAINRF